MSVPEDAWEGDASVHTMPPYWPWLRTRERIMDDAGSNPVGGTTSLDIAFITADALYYVRRPSGDREPTEQMKPCF